MSYSRVELWVGVKGHRSGWFACNVTPEISAVMEKSEAARMFALISSVNAVASIRFEEEWRCVSSVSLFLCRKAKAC